MLKSEALCGRYKQHGRAGRPDEVSTTNALWNDIHKLASMLQRMVQPELQAFLCTTIEYNIPINKHENTENLQQAW